MKRIVLLLIACGCINFSNAQTSKNANTLLWRISGNGLTKPSYLYGTMHLTDKRLFQLGDSVYKAIEQSDGFAAELDMNRVGAQMVNEFLKSKQDNKEKGYSRLKDLLDEKTWQLYKKQLEKKLGKKAELVTVNDIDKIKDKVYSDALKKGDMPTFLDAWLFGKARNQGKWVGGVEDLEDQEEHLNSESLESKIQIALFDDEYNNAGLEKFIRIYTSQNLDSIDAFMYRSEGGAKDYIMIKRNIKMARRMDSLSAIRSMVFAVGCAHLPGDSGVIALLRARGFTVTPVFSSKKIKPEDYKQENNLVLWQPVQIKDDIYSIKMPGIADAIDMFEEYGLNIKMFFDISLMKMYMTMGIDLPEERRKLGMDSLYRMVTKQYASNGIGLKEKEISINGTQGREYQFSTEDGEMRMQVFLPGTERIILNAVFGFNEKVLSGKESETFFQSFAYNNKPLRPETSKTEWKVYEYPLLAYSVEIPVKPQNVKRDTSEAGKTAQTWQSIDARNQIVYGGRIAKINEGLFNDGIDSSYFEGIKDRLKENLPMGMIRDSAFISIDGYPGYKVSATGEIKNERIESRVLSLERGGLSYYLYVVFTPGTKGQSAAERFLNSFKLLPYQHDDWKTVSDSGHYYSTSSVFPLKKMKVEENDLHPDAERHMMYDSLAGVSLYIDRTVLPDWLWYSSDTSFLRKRSKQYSDWQDSVSDYKVEFIDGLPTVSFTVRKDGQHIIKAVKLVLNGDELYEMFGHMAGQDLPGYYNKFIRDFKILKGKESKNNSLSKIDRLKEVVENGDKQAIKNIKSWWEYLDFTEKDIPGLQQLLLKVYPDFDTTYYSNFNSKLFDKIEWLDSNHTSTINYLRDHYSSIQPRDEYIKPLVISYLSGITTSESYQTLKKCLLDYPLNLPTTPFFNTSFYDSLRLTATLFPEIMKLGNNDLVWYVVSTLTTQLLDSNYLGKSAIKEYGKYFIAKASAILAKPKSEVEEDGYSYSDLIRILGIINTPESNSIVKKFSAYNQNDIRLSTTVALLSNNLPVDPKNLSSLAALNEYRHDLYDELKKINKLKYFPVNYLTQQKLGESKLYSYVTDDDPPEKIIPVGQRVQMYKGVLQKFYLYKFTFSEESNEYYLGVAGPYSTKPGEFSSTHDATGGYWEKEFDPKQIDELFKNYLKSLEEIDNDE